MRAAGIPFPVVQSDLSYHGATIDGLRRRDLNNE